MTEPTKPTYAPSPFLPGTQIQFAWDSTSLGYLKTCPRLYQYVMIDGWGHRESTDEEGSPGAKRSIHLHFGGEVHKAFEEYDKAKAEGISHEDALRLVVLGLLQRNKDWDAVEADGRAYKYKDKDQLLLAVIWTLDYFKDDACKTHILKNGKPAVELSFRFELDWGPEAGGQPYLLCGHLDRVVDFNGELFVLDYKTTTSTPGPYFFDGFAPNNQMTLYSLAGQIVVDSPIRGVIINAIQLLVGASRTTRGFTFRTPDQLEEWMGDLRYWFGQAESFARAGYWPMNDTACDKFGGCRFREICSKSPKVREQFLKGSFDKLTEEERWNPLRPR
jgi:hypothetical protein